MSPMSRLNRNLLAAALLAAAFQTPAIAAPVKVQGVVVTNQNGQLTIKTPNGDQTIVLPPNTPIRSISGVFGGQKEEVSHAALLPGLPVTIEGDDSSGRVVAGKVDYKASDYKTAVQINAGVQETARREAELRSAYSKMGDWDLRAEENIYFKTGSAAISAADKDRLMEIAGKAKGIKGYVVSVLGYADPRGNAAANERLSNRRAQAVINYLKQSGHLLPGRVLSASAMGEMNIPIDKADATAHASARRVTVRVLTSSAHLQP
jgi:outer membrane protein OmpA-like peptidoglycan-associated protein